MLRCCLAFVIALLIGSVALAGSPWIDFEGDYVIGGKTLFDPPPSEPRTTHIRFRIFGSAAKEMYDLIDVDPILDQCGPDHLTKLSGNIKCDYFDEDQSYACYFGVGLRDNEIVKAVWC